MPVKHSAGHSLVDILQRRFEAHRGRHAGLTWKDVHKALDANAQALVVLQAMEDTGGEPDVIGRDVITAELLYCDCSAESPTGRRSGCYDGEALRARKENKPTHSALELAAQLGVTMLDEAQYRYLQTLGEFDCKTSSWVQTPADVRALGGALFCDRRYNNVFVYHNGAQSYYAARGFRGLLRL
ncbi:MAG: DUF4256 domain-containing protein [Gemmatimonadaceae bacterium]|nr:DUF4256 domain-containing protein [Gemmatimonadaceae bacterium]